MKRILMIAYHFPPLAGSSGIQRTLRFVQHLPSFGWQPLVLTVHPRVYERVSNDLLDEVPSDLIVRRANALDAAKHLQFRGRYFGWTARPDRWMSWRFAGVRAGLSLIREFKPDVIWSTYPIATAHVIGAELHRRSGIPWVSDFRDPMAQDGYPVDPITWKAYQSIEEMAVANSSYAVFTTPSAARIYRDRYPASADRIVVIENGYDESSFPTNRVENAYSEGPVKLLHSGIVYPWERDPRQLFIAIKNLHDAGVLSHGKLQIQFRASAHDSHLQALAQELGVLNYIELLPPLPYREALAEMMTTDALLVMQAANCNAQIPAKIYEYLRAGRPVLGLTDPAGDTAGVLRSAGLNSMARLDSVAEIEAILPAFLAGIRAGTARLPEPDAVRLASRRGRTEALAELLQSAMN